MEEKRSSLLFCKSKDCHTILLDIESHQIHRQDLKKIPKELAKSLKFEAKIGQGSYGYVFRIFDPSDQMHKALKLFKTRSEDRDLEILKKLYHQNIVRYFRSGTYGKRGNKAFIVMELCDGDLNSVIKDDKIDGERKNDIFLQICEGLHYLHHKFQDEIVHRDLKPTNILLTKGDIRISDFGESKIIKKKDDLTEIKGTGQYLPPELLIADENEQIIPSKKQDMWSLGLIAHQLFAKGEHPFKFGRGWKVNVIEGNLQINYDNITKESALDFIIRGCLQKNPNDRLGIIEVVQILKTANSGFRNSVVLSPSKEEEEGIKKYFATLNLNENSLKNNNINCLNEIYLEKRMKEKNDSDIQEVEMCPILYPWDVLKLIISQVRKYENCRLGSEKK